MSTARTPYRRDKTPPHDRFRLLKAIFIGLGLGFIAVLLISYAMPGHGGRRKLAYLTSKTHDGSAAKKTGASSPAVKAAPREVHIADSDAGRAGKQAAAPPPPDKKPAGDASNQLGREKTGAEEQAASAVPSPAPDAGKPAPKAPQSPEGGGEAKVKPEPELKPAIELTYPKPFSEEEMTAALQPVLSFRVSDADAAAIKEVISAASKKQEAEARAALSKITDPAARKFAEWALLRALDASLANLRSFASANPLFPSKALDARAETALFLSDASSAEVLKFFANRKPLTGAGRASLGAALIDTGEKDKGAILVKHAWTRNDLDSAVEARFPSRFAGVIDEQDNALRKTFLSLKAQRRQAQETKQDAKNASDSKKSGGLKAAARLRSKHRSAHGSETQKAKDRISKLKKRTGRGGKRLREKDNGSSHRRRIRRRSAGEDVSMPVAADASGKASAFQLPASLTEKVALRRRWRHAASTKAARRRAALRAKAAKDKGSKNESGRKAGGDGDVKSDKAAGTKSEAPAKDQKKTGETKPGETLQQKTAGGAIKLSKEAASSPDALLARLKALSRQRKNAKMWSLLRSIPPTALLFAKSERWWEFRRTEALRALTLGHPKIAYAIVKAHGPLDDESEDDAEFLAGWIALRSLKDPELARRHFMNAKAARWSASARREARSDYWLARTDQALGHPVEAKGLFQEAARGFYTYYGALAKNALKSNAQCEFRAPPRPSPSEIASFVSGDAFKAVMIIKQLDLQPLMAAYVLDLARQLNDPVQITLLLELTERVAPPHITVRAAKIALMRGFPVEAYGFPALLPKFDSAGDNTKIELALLNALTRQESEFHTGSVSRVGARGLMQLMPETARLVAIAHKLKYEAPRLTSDPSYNVTLGSAFLATLLSGYDGSYVLSLAAYNAGPGRVTKWMKEFGDPRSKSVDPIDWIERIPFMETHDYVQRILESIQLYRCRFENGKARYQLLQDLHRGRVGTAPDFVEGGNLSEGETETLLP